MASSGATADGRGLVHARTLFGAIDDHLGFLVHNRPWVVEAHSEVLEEMAAAWIARGGENWLPSVDRTWVAEYVRDRPEADRLTGGIAVAEFFRWATREGLVPAA